MGLHAIAIGALRLTLSRVSAPSNANVRPTADLAWDVELLATPASPTPSRVAAPSSVVTQRPARAGTLPRSAAPVEELARTEAASSPLEAVEEPPAPAGEAVTSRRIDLGIGSDGWQRWLGAPQENAAAREPAGARANRFQLFRAPPASTTGGVQEGLERRDRELGLGPSGRVLSALHHTAHETIAPAAGKATFEVTVLGTGAVQVTLGSASGQPDAWKRVASRIAERLRAAPPRIPPRRQGARLVVELVAEETMPNGTKISSLKGPHLDAVPPKLTVTEDEQRKLELDNPTATNDAGESPLPPIKLDLPGVYLAERGKVCSYRLGLSVFGPVFQGGCDPSHIGAKPQRMVHARVLEESLF
jgi:hypothetical protein